MFLSFPLGLVWHSEELFKHTNENNFIFLD